MQQQLSDIYAILSGSAVPAPQQIGAGSFLFLMVTSLVASLSASYLYLQFYSRRETGSDVHRAFPLLGISVTAIFLCIQFSLPLSLGLLGALSIVRFRTPIKEPEEIGFVMFVIAVSIAIATLRLGFVAVIFLVAVGALLVQAGALRFARGKSDGTIVIGVPEGANTPDGATIAVLLGRRVAKAKLESVARNEGQVVYAYQFRGGTAAELLALQRELVARVEAATINVFLNRPAAL